MTIAPLAHAWLSSRCGVVSSLWFVNVAFGLSLTLSPLIVAGGSTALVTRDAVTGVAIVALQHPSRTGGRAVQHGRMVHR